MCDREGEAIEQAVNKQDNVDRWAKKDVVVTTGLFGRATPTSTDTDMTNKKESPMAGQEEGALNGGEVEFTKVTISMPKTMHEELRRRARRRGISVTELMRRAVALDAVVFDPNHPDRKIILKDENDTERILQPI
jgi:hypothetical protein